MSGSEPSPGQEGPTTTVVDQAAPSTSRGSVGNAADGGATTAAVAAGAAAAAGSAEAAPEFAAKATLRAQFAAAGQEQLGSRQNMSRQFSTSLSGRMKSLGMKYSRNFSQKEGDDVNGIKKLQSFATPNLLLLEYNALARESGSFNKEIQDVVKLAALTGGFGISAAAAAAAAGEDGFVEVVQEGNPVNRRSPINPLSLKCWGKLKLGKDKKAADPALRDNPLEGRLGVTIATSFALFVVYMQSLAYNFIDRKFTQQGATPPQWHKPSGNTLFQLGGLHTTQIRYGSVERVFMSMWLHTGWIHLIFNMATQLQFLVMIEPDWGLIRTTFLYFISGVTGK
eukprot:GHVU01187415.1.p1 GENE.GHVU01187415.1~~GHVU01187415.1.p1  ORF type:complete len:339 (-),score=51.46 GHVU01187415.1:51-1067(-)